MEEAYSSAIRALSRQQGRAKSRARFFEYILTGHGHSRCGGVKTDGKVKTGKRRPKNGGTRQHQPYALMSSTLAIA